MKKILVIDDDESILDAIKEILAEANYTVETLANTDTIFDTIDEFKPDLIIIDYLLSGINGGEFCHQVKTNPKTLGIPVIIISAYPKTLLSLGTYGADMFIAKPFDLQYFLDTVGGFVPQKSAS